MDLGNIACNDLKRGKSKALNPYHNLRGIETSEKNKKFGRMNSSQNRPREQRQQGLALDVQLRAEPGTKRALLSARVVVL
jgi:hypothetical protein